MIAKGLVVYVETEEGKFHHALLSAREEELVLVLIHQMHAEKIKVLEDEAPLHRQRVSDE